MIITVTPAPALDRTYSARHFELGSVNRATSSHVEPSGKGVNVSRALAAAGVATLAVLPLGGPEGSHLAQLLDADGVPSQGVTTDAPTRTNITLAVTGRATTKMNAPALPVAETVWTELLDVVATALTEQPGSWVLCSGSVPPGAESLPARLVQLAHEHGSRCAVDSSGAALDAALAAGPDLIAPNHLELAELVGVDASSLHPDGSADSRLGQRPPDEGSPDQALSDSRPQSNASPIDRPPLGLVRSAAAWSATLAARTGGAVLASLGAAGAIYTDRSGSWHALAPPVVPVNTVGAGDALLAGFLSVVGRDDDRHPADPAGALVTAVAWGTSACMMDGTSGDVAAGADLTAVVVRRLA